MAGKPPFENYRQAVASAVLEIMGNDEGFDPAIIERMHQEGREFDFHLAGIDSLDVLDIMFEVDKVQPKVMKKVLIKGRDLRSLLHNWLEELLLYLDSELFVLHSVKKIKISKLKEVYAVDATIMGETATDVTPRRGAAVKAVTYDEMELTPEFVQVVVDV